MSAHLDRASNMGKQSGFQKMHWSCHSKVTGIGHSINSIAVGDLNFKANDCKEQPGFL